MASTNSSEEAILTSLKEANDGLCMLSVTCITELRSYAKPPTVCQSVFEGVGVLFCPLKKSFDWSDARKLMNDHFLNKLVAFDTNGVTEDQVSRLTSILNREECRPERVRQVSSACHSICLWLRAVMNCASLQQQLAQRSAH